MPINASTVSPMSKCDWKTENHRSVSKLYSGNFTGGSQKPFNEMFDDDVLESSKENESAYCNSSVSWTRIVKRKVLRHKNGKAVISEEESTFTPSANSVYSSDSSGREVPTLEESLLSICSSSCNIDNESRKQSFITSSSRKGRQQKSDPVSRYHEYRKYWEAFKPPGETGHQSLRWAIREKMLEHNIR